MKLYFVCGVQGVGWVYGTDVMDILVRLTLSHSGYTYLSQNNITSRYASTCQEALLCLEGGEFHIIPGKHDGSLTTHSNPLGEAWRSTIPQDR